MRSRVGAGALLVNRCLLGRITGPMSRIPTIGPGGPAVERVGDSFQFGPGDSIADAVPRYSIKVSGVDPPPVGFLSQRFQNAGQRRYDITDVDLPPPAEQ